MKGGCRCWPYVQSLTLSRPLPFSSASPSLLSSEHVSATFSLKPFLKPPQPFSATLLLQPLSLSDLPMQIVSELRWQARISTSLSEHRRHGWQGFVVLCSSEKVPGPQSWHSVFPLTPHSLVTPWPRSHVEQGAHRPSKVLPRHRKKPSPHSQCVSWLAEQAASMWMPAGQRAQGWHGDRSSDEENVPGDRPQLGEWGGTQMIQPTSVYVSRLDP